MAILIIAGLGVGLSLAVPLIIIQAVSVAVHRCAEGPTCMLTLVSTLGNATERNGVLDLVLVAHSFSRRNDGNRRLPGCNQLRSRIQVPEARRIRYRVWDSAGLEWLSPVA